MMDLLKPSMGKIVYLVLGAALVAYTGAGRFLPKKG